MQDLYHYLKEDYDIGTIFYLVGSRARNPIMQNDSLPIDLDYNLEIVKCEDHKDCRFIKECARKSFDKALCEHGWGNCNDSTSALTTEWRYFTKRNHTEFSMDICIVCKDTKDYFYRMIHKKTGFTYRDEYYWNKALILRAYIKKLNISMKGKNENLSDCSIGILITYTCNKTTITILFYMLYRSCKQCI